LAVTLSNGRRLGDILALIRRWVGSDRNLGGRSRHRRAIWAALLIARRDNAVRIKAGATVGQIAGDPAIPLERRHLWISVTNLGRRTFMLQSIGWRSGLLHPKWGFLSRVYAVQNVMAPHGPNQPLKIQDGDVANRMVPLDEWLGDSIAKLIAEPHWLGLRTLRILAYASTGDTASSKISQSLGERIRAKLEAPPRQPRW
jgi:hypothetical protein